MSKRCHFNAPRARSHSFPAKDFLVMHSFVARDTFKQYCLGLYLSESYLLRKINQENSKNKLVLESIFGFKEVFSTSPGTKLCLYIDCSTVERVYNRLSEEMVPSNLAPTYVMKLQVVHMRVLVSQHSTKNEKEKDIQRGNKLHIRLLVGYNLS